MDAAPHRDELNIEVHSNREAGPTVAGPDWRVRLPDLQAFGVTIRQLRLADAPSLMSLLMSEEVTRFISPPPTTVEGFERFICWTIRQQAAGRYVCFGLVPDGYDAAVGIIQLRALDFDFSAAEWGFAIGSPFWGTGVFVESARAVVDFAFDVLGVHRLEARAAVSNPRGNGALRKLGASPEGVLRKAFYRNGQYLDQVLWTIIGAEWRLQAKAVWGSRIH